MQWIDAHYSGIRLVLSVGPDGLQYQAPSQNYVGDTQSKSSQMEDFVLKATLVATAICIFGLCAGSVMAQESDEAGYQPYDTTREFPALGEADWIEDNPYRVSLFDPKSGEDKERLWSQTKLMFGLGLGVAGFIAMLPPEISNWDRSDDRLLEKWRDNVKEGPVWDRDVWYINYIGHPYFGSVYYQVARKSGYRQWDAFVYSFMMSTFYWEYGLEAFAEVPSIQDLVVTPVGGWLWGEWSYHKEKEIRSSGGMVWGSRAWGNVALFLLDPVDTIGVGLNKMMGREVVKAGTAWVSANPAPAADVFEQSGDYYWSFNLAYEF